MAEPDVRPPGAASPSAKWIYLVEIPLAEMAAGEWIRKLYPRTTWRMHFRQLTVYEHFGWINMHAITFLFVDQGSLRRLEKFGEDIHSPEIIGTHTLNFRPKLIFFCN